MNDTGDPSSAGLMGECLLATVGVQDFLSRTHRRVLVDDHARAARIPSAISRQLDAFVRGEAPPKDDRRAPGRIDYPELLEQLARPIEPGDVENLVGQHKEAEDALEVFVPLTRAVAFLNGAAPRRATNALTGPEPIRPSDQEVAKFARVFAVVDDPLTILQRMRSGPVLADEVAAVRSVYPAIYTEMAARAQNAIADAMTERKGFRLPHDRDKALRSLLPDLGPRSPGLVRDMQQTFANSAQAQQQPPPKRKRADLGGSNFQTTGQRAESGGK